MSEVVLGGWPASAGHIPPTPRCLTRRGHPPADVSPGFRRAGRGHSAAWSLAPQGTMSEGHPRALDSARPKDGGLGEPQELKAQGHCGDHLRDHLREGHGQSQLSRCPTATELGRGPPPPATAPHSHFCPACDCRTCDRHTAWKADDAECTRGHKACGQHPCLAELTWALGQDKDANPLTCHRNREHKHVTCWSRARGLATSLFQEEASGTPGFVF